MRVLYTVTQELHTPWWLKLFRFLRLAKKMKTFQLTFDFDWYGFGDLLYVESGGPFKIVDVHVIKCSV